MQKTMCELFAGVGGFHAGMDALKSGWECVWFSQWEPGKKKQWAHDCYVKHFGDCKDLRGEYHTGEDVSLMDKPMIPDHSLLLVSAPCQDYSVARAKNTSMGIQGKKGVLWWQVVETLEAKKASFMLFENVDRLLKSPAKQRGRDFGVMLACLNKLGYRVEWRVVNAALYGAAQKRRRVFVFAYHESTEYAKMMDKKSEDVVLGLDGFMQKAFPAADGEKMATVTLDTDIAEVSDKFVFNFQNAGYMKDGQVFTEKLTEIEEAPITLGSILQKDVDEKYYLSDDLVEKWRYMRSYKRIPKISKDGFPYMYNEGAMAFPDPLDKPGRTILTGEATVSRTSHIVLDPQTNRYRVLTPVETERLQGFSDDWTKDTMIGEMSDRMRYFCMGNSLVVPMITRMGKILDDIISKEK